MERHKIKQVKDQLPIKNISKTVVRLMHIKCEKLHVLLPDEGTVMKCASLCHRAVKTSLLHMSIYWLSLKCGNIHSLRICLREHVYPRVLQGHLGIKARHVRALISKQTAKDCWRLTDALLHIASFLRLEVALEHITKTTADCLLTTDMHVRSVPMWGETHKLSLSHANKQQVARGANVFSFHCEVEIKEITQRNQVE